MNELMDWLNHGLEGLFNLIKNPFMWLGLFVSGFIIHLHIRLTRKLFYRKFQVLLREVAVVAFAATLTGALVSVPLYWLAPDLAPLHLSVVWGFSIFLFFFRVRLMHAFYPVAILSVFYGAMGLAGWPEWSGMKLFTGFLHDLPLAQLWYMLAMVWAGEAVLLRFIGRRLSVPLNVQRLRSRVIGGYWSEFSIPLPVWLFTSASSFVPIPMFVSRAQRIWSNVPDQAIRRSTPGLIGLGILAGGTGAALQFAGSSDPESVLMGWIALIVPLLMLAFVEWGVTVRENREINREPLFIHGRRGYRVLGVVPGSQAEQMEIRAGDIIHKVNGYAVRTRTQWHEAMAVNPAFCKLEVENLDGHVQLMQRALYADRDHQLGLVFCPDGETKQFVRLEETNWWRVIRNKLLMIKPVVSPSMVVNADTLDQWPGAGVLGLPPVGESVVRIKVEEQPEVSQPVVSEPLTEPLSVPDPVTERPATSEPVAEQQAVNEPNMEQPATEADPEVSPSENELVQSNVEINADPVNATGDDLPSVEKDERSVETPQEEPVNIPVEPGFQDVLKELLEEPAPVVNESVPEIPMPLTQPTPDEDNLLQAEPLADLTAVSAQRTRRKKKQPVIEDLIEQLETHASAISGDKFVPEVQGNEKDSTEIVDTIASVLQTDSEKPKRTRKKKPDVPMDELLDEVVPLLDKPKRERQANTATIQQEEMTNG